VCEGSNIRGKREVLSPLHEVREREVAPGVKETWERRKVLEKGKLSPFISQ
jgi:hypothetical protein